MLCIVYDVTGEFATDADDGQCIYDYIHPFLTDGIPVDLDFKDVTVFSSAFFTFSIGQLLEDLSIDVINRLLSVQNISSDGRRILTRAIANAKLYYGDRHYQAKICDLGDRCSEPMASLTGGNTILPRFMM